MKIFQNLHEPTYTNYPPLRNYYVIRNSPNYHARSHVPQKFCEEETELKVKVIKTKHSWGSVQVYWSTERAALHLAGGV